MVQFVLILLTLDVHTGAGTYVRLTDRPLTEAECQGLIPAGTVERPMNGIIRQLKCVRAAPAAQKPFGDSPVSS